MTSWNTNAPQAGPVWGQVVETPGYVTRVYKGKLHDATVAFQVDAANMAQHGWTPISQNYQPGSWGTGAFIVAILLFLLVIGLLVFLYLLIVKPDGSLVVLYKHKDVP